MGLANVKCATTESILIWVNFNLILAFWSCKNSIRELLHTKKRRDDTIEQLAATLGDAIISVDLELVGPEITACSQASSFLPTAITEDVFDSTLSDSAKSGILSSESVSITMDNSLSPAHTLVQIICQDHKGLLYDIMRTLKDYNIQVCNGSEISD